MNKSLIPVALLAAAVICPVGAQAAQTHLSTGSFGTFTNPGPVAVDTASGDVYVLDAGASNVQRFDAAGNPEPFTAGTDAGTNALTGFSFDGGAASQVAVDNSAGATAGDIYVASMGGVDIYAPDGTHLGQLTQANGAPFAVEACGVAVGPTGTVYVAEYGGNIDRYLPAANPVVDADYDAQITGASSPCQLAADSTGAVYANTWSSGPLTEYDASQFGSLTPVGTVLGGATATAVAVDASNDNVYVDEGGQISQYDASGTLVSTFGSAQLANSGGIAVNGVTGAVYASNNAGTVAMFGPLVNPPDATTGDASQIAPTTATLGATINPQGLATSYQFEYGTDTAYGSTAPVAPADAGSGSADVAVTAALSGLHAQTTYHYRVVAISGGAHYPGADHTFKTQGPVATLGEITDLTTTSAAFHGSVDTRGLTGGTYRFIITATNSAYGEATEAVAVPAGSGAVPVSAGLADLPPAGTFTVRLQVSAGGAAGYSDPTGFATPALPPYVPQAPRAIAAAPYGCTAPRLDVVNGHPEPGDTVTVTGADLGVGGAIAVGSLPVSPIAWSATAITFAVPQGAVGTLPLTINCGSVSNSVGLALFQEPDNDFTITKSSVSGTAATLSVKLPGAGRLQTSGANTAAKRATVTKAGTTKITVKLSSAGKRALAKAKSGRLRVSVRVRFTPTGGHAADLTTSLTFKRKAHR